VRVAAAIRSIESFERPFTIAWLSRRFKVAAFGGMSEWWPFEARASGAAAMDIYADLVAQTQDIQRRAALEARLAELRQASLSQAPTPDSAIAGVAPESDSPRRKLIGKLEKLAERLERRTSA